MALIYSIFIRLYFFAIQLASLWNSKAKEWIKGRKNLFEELKQKIKSTDKIIWIHCASAGEFEQGKPVIEKLKQSYPHHKILVSIFSPSGYGSAKKYPYADIVTYLPLDTRMNAKRFIVITKPELVIFVKYEYWYHHLSEIAFHHIPLIMVSAIFRKDQLFFKWYGKFYRQMLFLFRHIFVQDESSLVLLKENNLEHCSISGDTRFDRVKKIANQFSEIPFIKEFIGESKVIVAGSTWPDDEKILTEYVKTNKVKIIVAPHEIKQDHLLQIQKNFPDCIRYSELKNVLSENVTDQMFWNAINEQQHAAIEKNLAKAKTLIIDNVGMLSRLYHYATITYVGGGFKKSGIHNTIEAAVYGKPVFFGPNYEKFKEARDLIQAGVAFTISSFQELKIKMDHLLNDPEQLLKAGEASKTYVENNVGATNTILQFIQENRLLTN